MGEVYRVRDTKLDRDVALKFLTRVGGPDIEYSARLRREAKSLAALNHQNIVTIHDIDETDGIPFLILEWVPGSTLSDPRHGKPFDKGIFFRAALIPGAQLLPLPSGSHYFPTDRSVNTMVVDAIDRFTC